MSTELPHDSQHIPVIPEDVIERAAEALNAHLSGSGDWSKATPRMAERALTASGLPARVAELEAALSEARDTLGAVHMVIEGPNAGWTGTDMELGEPGWYDEDYQPDPNCKVCAVERKIDALLSAAVLNAKGAPGADR